MNNALATSRVTARVVRRASLLSLFCAGIAGGQAPAITEFDVGGIKVIHKPVTANDVVAVQLVLKGGAAVLTPATAGIEHLLTATATSGTEKYSKDAFSALATSTGTEIGGSVSLDYSSFSMQGVRQHFDEAWDLFTQAVLHPTFPDEEVAQVRDQIVNDLKQRTDDPDSYLNLVADSLLYAGHPYAVDVDGTEATIARFTRADLLAWHERRMRRSNLVVVVVGNVAPAVLRSKIAAAFGSLPAAGDPAPAVRPIVTTASSVNVVQRELPTNYILGLYPAPGRSSPDYAAMQMTARVLGERLLEEVRTKRSLTYAVGSSISGARQSKGNLYVTAVQPDTTVRVIFSEVRKIQREPVSRSRLGETINVVVTGYWMGQETNMGQAQSLALWEVTGGGWRNARLYVDRMKAVTAADIQRVAAKYLKNARFVVIGDPKKVNQALFTSF